MIGRCCLVVGPQPEICLLNRSRSRDVFNIYTHATVRVSEVHCKSTWLLGASPDVSVPKQITWKRRADRQTKQPRTVSSSLRRSASARHKVREKSWYEWERRVMRHQRVDRHQTKANTPSWDIEEKWACQGAYGGVEVTFGVPHTPSVLHLGVETRGHIGGKGRPRSGDRKRLPIL